MGDIESLRLQQWHCTETTFFAPEYNMQIAESYLDSIMHFRLDREQSLKTELWAKSKLRKRDFIEWK